MAAKNILAVSEWPLGIKPSLVENHWITERWHFCLSHDGLPGRGDSGFPKGMTGNRLHPRGRWELKQVLKISGPRHLPYLKKVRMGITTLWDWPSPCGAKPFPKKQFIRLGKLSGT